MKIAGMDMPNVSEDFGAKVEFECALAVEDYDKRMMKHGIAIPQQILVTLHEIMCGAAAKTIMGAYDESK